MSSAGLRLGFGLITGEGCDHEASLALRVQRKENTDRFRIALDVGTISSEGRC